MKEYYAIAQYAWSRDTLLTPRFPVNDQSMMEMLDSGIAVQIPEPRPASIGEAIYERDNGSWKCYSQKWDTSD